MEQNGVNMGEKIFSEINTSLLNIITDLQQALNNPEENILKEKITEIINRLNSIVEENKKSTYLLITHIKSLEDKADHITPKKPVNFVDIKEIRMDDRKYIGQVINGIPEGKGVMYVDGGDIYKGEFRNGKYEGKGIYYFNENDATRGNRYEGDFRNGEADGKGIYYKSNDDRYEGDWKKDLKEGKGIYFWSNGDRYEGEWKNDKRDGKGIYYWDNGNREMGDYSNGKEVGKHVLLTTNGEVKVINYKE